VTEQDQPGQSPEDILEAQLREARLRIQNDTRLSASQKQAKISVLTGSGFGDTSRAELYDGHEN
jgi:hypothetical protein